MSKEVQKIVKNVFGNGYAGYAVEAGAFDGIFESTTVELEKQDGWKVLLVEPIPEIFKKLVMNRLSAHCIQVALGSVNEDNVPFEVFEDYGGASISSLVPDEQILAVFNPKDDSDIETIRVNKRTLEFCLDRFQFPQLDLLALDVEGGELDVLKGIDLDKWKPKLIVVENIFNRPVYAEYLTDYKQIDKLRYDDVFLRKE